MAPRAVTDVARLSRGTVTTLLGLSVVVVLCWWYLIDMASGMDAMPMTSMLTFRPWTPDYFLAMFLMWAVMMVAMMVPSAVPMILLYRQVAYRNACSRAGLGTALFVSGYIAVWTLFSLAATVLQWQLETLALMSSAMKSNSLVFSAVVLIAAGLYQWSPWKDACLRQCQSPFHFIMQRWRPGPLGALSMGLLHGSFCVGCCAFLMGLLFVGGVMDLTVIALIAIVVLLEKILPWYRVVPRLLGSAAMLLGLLLLAQV